MLGGENATITDARVVLGNLNNEALLAGRLPIDADLSFKAVQKLADKIGMDVYETAKGIVSVSNANIIREIKNVTVEKGYNPSEFCLVPFGGSGPLHAAELIEELMIEKSLIPKAPGLLAAYGLLTEDMRRDFVQTHVMNCEGGFYEILNKEFRRLEDEAETWFDKEGIDKEKRRMEYFLDMRYSNG